MPKTTRPLNQTSINEDDFKEFIMVQQAINSDLKKVSPINSLYQQHFAVEQFGASSNNTSIFDETLKA